jgi:hypothetical protein
MTDYEIDAEFLEEYKKLCEKYDRCIDLEEIEYSSALTIRKPSEAEYSVILTPKERDDRYQKSIEDTRIQLEKEKLEKEKIRSKRVKEFLDSGGKLDIHGEIPVPNVTYSLIDVSINGSPLDTHMLSSCKKGLRWGAQAARFEKIYKEITELLNNGMFKSAEIQSILKEKFYKDDIKEAITDMWEKGIISFRSDFKIYLVDRTMESD